MTQARRNLVLAFVGLLVAAGLAYFGTGLQKEQQRTSEPPSLIPPSWTIVRESPGHKKHVGKGKIACRDCHDESDGGFRSLREGSCTSCHAKEVARTHAGNAAKPTPCLTCHEFGEKTSPTCLECHANAQGKRPAVAVHISAGSPCTSCHHPHEELRSSEGDCGTCHEEISAKHGAMKVSGAADKQHALDALAPPTQWFGATGAKGATHGAAGTCSDCHAPHARAALARGSCKGCHENAAPGNKPSGHAACVTCHSTPHELTRTAVKACAGCHQEKRAAITPSHADCKTCHTPHATQTAVTSCKTCHEHKVTLGALKVEAHAACGSCHKPHDKKASPGAACVTCHTKTSVTHGPGRSEKCADCHSMHPGGGAGTSASIAFAEKASLAVPCTTCHKGQATSDASAHPKGVACTSCHKPHDFPVAAAKGAFCAKCHASETKLARASHGHNDCVKCHSDIHKPTRGAPCATCHGAEATTAPAGHRDCQKCHEPHDGHTKPSATCQSCHAREAATKHANVKGACAACHRPHGPNGPKGPAGAMAAPPCTTCHESAKLPGLHKLAGASPAAHNQCATCHSTHQPTRADRATCTSCHEKQKNHQPTATQCNGCHIFRRP